jgi:hypothetical protein
MLFGVEGSVAGVRGKGIAAEAWIHASAFVSTDVSSTVRWHL